jgi:transcription elongation factor Elf1
MPYQQLKPRSFGADDKLACPNCSKPTSLTRRGPEADYHLDYERQIFTCRACGQQIERVVNVDGNPPE